MDNTRSARSRAERLSDVKQLASSASGFKSIDRKSLNVDYVDEYIDNMLNPLPQKYEKAPNYLLAGNLGRYELISLNQDTSIKSKLGRYELSTARYLREVLQNDALITGVRETLTDSFVNFLLNQLGFGLEFGLKLQADYYFEIGRPSIRIGAKVEFSIEKDGTVVCFDEDKHLRGIGAISEYGETQMAGEMLACAYWNYNDAESKSRGCDQTVFAIRVIGTRFTFYKGHVSSNYIQYLGLGFPPDDVRVTIHRYPAKSEATPYGYDYADVQQRARVLELLVRLREHVMRI